MTQHAAARTEVLAANAAFYRAMRQGDLAAMDGLWAEARTVTCTHPSGPMIEGRAAVMESWRLILTRGVPPRIVADQAQVIVTGRIALVLCRERIGTATLIASNAFVREGRGWRLVNHQAAHVPAGAAQA